MSGSYIRKGYAIPLSDIINEFECALHTLNCDAMVAINRYTLIKAGMDRAFGFSRCRGTAYRTIVNEMIAFGLPPMVSQELFDQYTQNISTRISSLFNYKLGFTDAVWLPLDDSSVCVVERAYGV